MAFGFDNSSIVSALLLFLTNVIKIRIAYKTNRFDFRTSRWEKLEPDYLDTFWEFRDDIRNLYTVHAVLNIFSWILFSTLIVRAAWILSLGGKFKPGLHTAMVIIAAGGGWLEMVAKLLIVGREQISRFMYAHFNFQEWIVTNDKVGIRALEICYIMTYGKTTTTTT